MKPSKRYWSAFKDVAIVFSFAVNFALVVLLLALTMPAVQAALTLTDSLAEPLLGDLDEAFVGLGEATIDTIVHIDEPVPVQFDVQIDQQLPIDFQLPIEQSTAVVLTDNVPLYGIPARFTLPGGGGVINGQVSLSLPVGLRLPIQLGMVVPVSQTIPVRLDVPVDHTIRVQMDVPVEIELGKAGLDPAVQELREVFRPLRIQVQRLPDTVELW
jgi:hypothetical protein